MSALASLAGATRSARRLASLSMPEFLDRLRRKLNALTELE
jgi:hypothetical protein